MVKIAVIGGGASGLACAIELMHTVKDNDEVKVTVFEKLSAMTRSMIIENTSDKSFEIERA